jgi:(E)-4-hydroxy-3-methylbut-2-enyl-diphosphate synthase
MQSPYTENDIDRFRRELLQASRRVFFEPEYVACPGCGRTLFNIESVFSEVKKRTAHLKDCYCCMMHCQCPEKSDADYGYVGEEKQGIIYRGRS